MAASLVLVLYVINELNFDRFHEKAGSIYRLYIRARVGDTKINQTYSSARMFREMREKYPEIESGVKFFKMLAGLAIIVAILGLLGLASFMAQRRTREIAIRKVSGAGVVQIINLLTWKFVKWVLISFVLACPVAWWVMNRWLQDFAYRVSLNAWVFILSGIIALFLVIITVCIVTFRAASVNPAESMKYE